MNADIIRIECEEDGFWMVVRTDELEGDIRIRIHDIAEEVYDHVKAAIGPWLRERDEARTAVARGVTLEEYLRDEYAHERTTGQHAPFICAAEDVDESGGNDASDFYSIHTDIWDNREGK